MASLLGHDAKVEVEIRLGPSERHRLFQGLPRYVDPVQCQRDATQADPRCGKTRRDGDGALVEPKGLLELAARVGYLAQVQERFEVVGVERQDSLEPGGCLAKTVCGPKRKREVEHRDGGLGIKGDCAFGGRDGPLPVILTEVDRRERDEDSRVLRVSLRQRLQPSRRIIEPSGVAVGLRLQQLLQQRKPVFGIRPRPRAAGRGRIGPADVAEGPQTCKGFGIERRRRGQLAGLQQVYRIEVIGERGDDTRVFGRHVVKFLLDRAVGRRARAAARG